MERYFGTDGIRGAAGVFPIDEAGARRLGGAVAQAMADQRERIYVVRDTRPSGAAFAEAICDGLTAGGCEAVDLGVLPTPAASFHLARHGGAGAIVVSASHNPARDNGFKLFGPGGTKVSETLEAAVEQVFVAGPSTAATRGQRLVWGAAAREEYVDFILSTLPPGTRLDGLKLALDCAHGSTWQTTPAALERLGAQVVTMAADDDGASINHCCGSQHPEAVRALADEHGAHLGLAHDGDGDRVVLVDEDRHTVDGDRIIGLCAEALHARGELPGGHIVGTVMTNIGLELWLKRRGLTLHRAKVGDRNVWTKMVELGAQLGGEPSGHLIFRQLLPTDDALLTALHFLAIAATGHQRVADLAAGIPLAPMVLHNLKVTARPALETIPAVSEAIGAARVRLNGSGRVLVRYSGTELLARIMAEGEDDGLLHEVVSEVAAAFRHAGLAA